MLVVYGSDNLRILYSVYYVVLLLDIFCLFERCQQRFFPLKNTEISF